MNKEELNGLLDNIYELEGLVHLALAREDCPESLPELIVRKANSLTQLVNEIGGELHINPEDLQQVPEVVENREPDEITEDIVPDEKDAMVENEDLADDVEDGQHFEDDAQNEIGDIPTIVNESASLENTPIEEISPSVEEIEESAFAAYTLPTEEPAPQPQKIVEPRGGLPRPFG